MPSAVPAPPSTTPKQSGLELARQAADACRARYGREPERTVLSPGRVNLIGEHVDYNGGFVLPMAIDRHVVIAGLRTAGRVATIASTSRGDLARIPLDTPINPGEPSWSNYLRGVLAWFQEQGVTVPGFEAVVVADLPLGGGLSSSAALEVATCRFLESLTGHHVGDLDCIRLCQNAEHRFAGVPCGIMDQFIVTTARRDHALLLDCQSLEYRHVPVASDQVALIITHSGVAHELGKGEYAKRRADCQRAAATLNVETLRSATCEQLEAAAPRLDPPALRRARHVINEIERTTRFAANLERRQWTAAGELMYASHASLRDDYQVSCTELDRLVAIARELGEELGVYGARLTGAGFGGCTITLARRAEAEAVRVRLLEEYHRQTGVMAQSFISPPVAGARIL